MSIGSPINIEPHLATPVTRPPSSQPVDIEAPRTTVLSSPDALPSHVKALGIARRRDSKIVSCYRYWGFDSDEAVQAGWDQITNADAWAVLLYRGHGNIDTGPEHDSKWHIGVNGQIVVFAVTTCAYSSSHIAPLSQPGTLLHRLYARIVELNLTQAGNMAEHSLRGFQLELRRLCKVYDDLDAVLTGQISPYLQAADDKHAVGDGLDSTALSGAASPAHYGATRKLSRVERARQHPKACWGTAAACVVIALVLGVVGLLYWFL